MEKLKRLKWIILFILIVLLGGFLSTLADWSGGMFTGTWNFISGMLLLGGFVGSIWSIIRLKNNK